MLTFFEAEFDGEKILLPEEARKMPPGKVILVFQDGLAETAERAVWLKAQEHAFARAWENDEDSAYDAL